ncbi:unnamed protein product, partial [Prorocentrum cordatum]
FWLQRTAKEIASSVLSTGLQTARTPPNMPHAGCGTGTLAITARFLHKTRMCVYHAKGHCARGEECSFAHGSGDLRTVPDFSYTQPCQGFARTGKCRRGDACTFAHAPGKLLPWQCSEAPSPAETEHAEHGSEGASPAHGPPAPAELERQRAPHGAPVGLGRPLGDRPPGPAPAGGARAARAGGAAAAEGHRQADVPPLLRGEWGGGRPLG